MLKKYFLDDVLWLFYDLKVGLRTAYS